MSDNATQYRSSGAEGWMGCPQWQSESTESEYAAEGTMLHEAVRDLMLMGQETLLTDEQADMVEFVMEAVQEIASTSVWVEQPLSIAPVTGERGATGTPDLVMYDRESCMLYVVDHKFGYMPVAAQGNKQLGIYAAAFLHAHDLDVAQICLVVIQPRLKAVDKAIVTRKDLDELSAKAKAAVAAHGTREAVPSEKSCQWCKHAGRCDAQNQWVMTTVSDDFVDLTDLPSMTAKLENAIKLVDAVDSATLSRMNSATTLIEQWAAKVKQRTQDLLTSGYDVPGYKLVEGRAGNRKWADPVQAAYGLAALGMTPDNIYKSEVLSPAQAEKLLAPNQRSELDKLVTRSDPKPVVAKDSDKRPAIVSINQFPKGDSDV